MRRPTWSRPARDDLRRIRAYIEPRDPDAAANIIAAILDRVEQLASFPLSGPPFEAGGFRKLSVGGYPYIIIYRSRDDEVTILRIHHGAEDWRAAR